MVAVALEESGLDPTLGGDKHDGKFTSWGLFQLHEGGMLGSLTAAEAKDPKTNADIACAAFAKVGGKTASGKAGLLLYYVNVGRGSSNSVPTEKAWALYPQAQALVKKNGG
jgi:hypothetical protein